MPPIRLFQETPSLSNTPEPNQTNFLINLFLKYCCCCCSRRKTTTEPLTLKEKKTPLLAVSLSCDDRILTAGAAGVGSVAFSPKISKDTAVSSQEKPLKTDQKNRPGTPYYFASHIAKPALLESPESTPDVAYLTIHQGHQSSPSLIASQLPFAPPMLVATAGAGIDSLYPSTKATGLISPTSTPDDGYLSTDEVLERSTSLRAFTLPSSQAKCIATDETIKQRALPLLMRKDSLDSLSTSPSPFTVIDDVYLSSPKHTHSSPGLYVSPLNLSTIQYYAELFNKNGLKKELPVPDLDTKIAVIAYIAKYNTIHDVTALIEILNKPENKDLFELLDPEIQDILILYSQSRTGLGMLKYLNKKDVLSGF